MSIYSMCLDELACGVTAFLIYQKFFFLVNVAQYFPSASTV